MENKKRSFPQSRFRLLWELAQQGYQVEFNCVADKIICSIKKDNVQLSAQSNNAPSALSVAWSRWKKIFEL